MRSLVRLLSAAGIIGIFAAVAFAFNGAVTFDPTAASVGNAKLLVRAIQQYAQDHDLLFPPTVPSNAFRKALQPYVSNAKVFVSPITNTYYVPNPAINMKFFYAFADRENTVLFQDAAVQEGGKSTVAYVDGTVLYGGQEYGDLNQICENRAKQVALGVLQYTQDYDECMPPMKTAAEFEAAVYPYVRSHRAFICPSTNEHFKPTAGLSYRPSASILNPALTVVFTDPDAHADGFKTVGYVDGHITHGTYNSNARNGDGSARAHETACAYNERRLGFAAQVYALHNDNRLPEFTTYNEFISNISRFLTDKSVVRCPDTKLDYTVNVALSGIDLSTLPSPATTWLITDAQPHIYGSYNTLMADGHVEQYNTTMPVSLSVLGNNNVRLLWEYADAGYELWTIDASGAVIAQPKLPSEGRPVVSSSVDSSGRSLLLRSLDSTATLQYIAQDGTVIRSVENGPYDGWDPAGMAVGSNNQPHLLWNHFDGVAADWNMTTGVNYIGNIGLGPVAAARAAGIAVAPDNTQRMLWIGNNGSSQIWTLGINSQFVSAASFNPVQAWTPLSIAVGPDGVTHMLRINTSHHARIWTIAGDGSVSSNIAVVPKGDWSPVAFAVGSDNNYRVLFAGPAGALVEVVNSAGTVLSAHIYERPSA